MSSDEGAWRACAARMPMRTRRERAASTPATSRVAPGAALCARIGRDANSPRLIATRSSSGDLFPAGRCARVVGSRAVAGEAARTFARSAVRRFGGRRSVVPPSRRACASASGHPRIRAHSRARRDRHASCVRRAAANEPEEGAVTVTRRRGVRSMRRREDDATPEARATLARGGRRAPRPVRARREGVRIPLDARVRARSGSVHGGSAMIDHAPPQSLEPTCRRSPSPRAPNDSGHSETRPTMEGWV